MAKKHFVVIKTDDGGREMHQLKPWVRNHPNEVPPDVDLEGGSSHDFRKGLKRRGWIMEETENEIHLLHPGTPSPEEDDVEEDGREGDEAASFALEYQLRDFLADNLSVIQIAGKSLTLYKDSRRSGVEYPTDVGPIDILALDGSGNFFVFELKRATSPDRAMGQVARYMGWIKHTIGKDKEVYGVIVGKAISEKLKFARTVIPNVFLFEYEVSFKLRPSHELAAGGPNEKLVSTPPPRERQRAHE